MVGVVVEGALFDVGDVAFERVFVVLGQRERPDAFAGGVAGFNQNVENRIRSDQGVTSAKLLSVWQ